MDERVPAVPPSAVGAAIEWRDLLALSRAEILSELALPLPWLVLALLAAEGGLHAAAVPAAFVLFMTGLRVTHGAFHHSLGLPRRGDDLVMLALSVLLGGSMHAIEYTHLRHHRDCLGDGDVEGSLAHHGFWQALLRSPVYPLLIHLAALRGGSRRQRRWVQVELLAAASVQIWVWGGSGSEGLQTISLALLFANASAAMVGIWAVHRHCDGSVHPARSSRSRMLDYFVAGMFHHLEHHLYPAVPTRRLRILADRFDACRRAPLLSVWHSTPIPPKHAM